MKKLKMFFPLLIGVLLLNTGCGNSGQTETTTTSDTAIQKDTIDRNTENFSAPH